MRTTTLLPLDRRGRNMTAFYLQVDALVDALVKSVPLRSDVEENYIVIEAINEVITCNQIDGS